MSKEIKERLSEIVADKMCLMVDPYDDDNLVNDLGMDSLDFYSVVYEIEDEYGVTINDKSIERVFNNKLTFGEFAKFVCRQVEQNKNK